MEHLPVKSRQECCMCGDHGFSDELFRCKICHFRSQHRYCSNLYPKTDVNRVCNWCLSKRKTDETLIISPCKKRSIKDEEEGEIKKTKREVDGDGRGRVIEIGDACKVVNSMSTKKTRRRRRIITKGELEEKVKVKRSKSQEMIKVKNKVKRYKLLDEVAT